MNIEKGNFTRNQRRKEKGKKPLRSKEKRSVFLGNVIELVDFTSQKKSLPLITQIQEDINTALRGGERLKLTTLRILLSVIQQREKDTGKEITDDAIMAIIEKQVQLRKEASELYKEANRSELFKKENEEISILQGYLPEKIDTPELTKIIETIISKIGAKTMQDMGQIMAELKSQSQGSIDMKQASNIVRMLLSQG